LKNKRCYLASAVAATAAAFAIAAAAAAITTTTTAAAAIAAAAETTRTSAAATTAATATMTTATAAAAKPGFDLRGIGFCDLKNAAFYFFAIEGFHSRCGFRIGCHLNKTITFILSCFTIGHNIDTFHDAKL
jgi:hypothetical protein